MKRTIFIVIIGFLIFTTCKKKDDGILYFLDITGLSADTVMVDDTLEVYIDWKNSEPTDQVSAFINEVEAEVLRLNNDNTIEIIIPTGWYYGSIKIIHPNGAEAYWDRIYKNSYPHVHSISATSGKAGDVITITGKEFLASEKTAIRINTLDCEIVEMQDTLIRFEVPDSCGNGLIRLLYWNRNILGCVPSIILDLAIFNYETTGTNHRPVIRYSYYSMYYEIERDGEGRVFKRYKLSDTGTPTGSYDTFMYGTDGLLETINFYYPGDERYKYKVYSRNHDGSHLEIIQYDDNNDFIDKVEIHYLNGKMVQYNNYFDHEGIVYLQFSNQYTYEDNKARLVRTFYNYLGEITGIKDYEIEYDIYNNGFPELGIPGFEILNEFPYITPNNNNVTNYYKIYYNETGEFIRADKFLHCEYYSTNFSYEYE